MPRIRLPANGWQPRPYQRGLWEYLEGGGRRACIIWHRRSGKDELCLHWTAVSAFQKPATYWHMLPEAAQARKAIWDSINPHTGLRRIDEAFPPEIRDATREDQMFLKLKSGATWQVVGSDNFNSLVGSPPYGVVFSEWPLANPAAYAYLSPILRENGGWAIFNGTPRGKNHGFKTLQRALNSDNWFGQVLRADETKAITPEALAEELADYIGMYGADMGQAVYDQEYFCSFDAAIIGAYWGAEMAVAERDGRIGSYAVDPALPVHTAWDLGVGANLAIWFWQALAGKIAVVDYYQSHDGNIEAAAAEIVSKGYRRGTDWVPHDAKVRDIGTGRTRIETMIKAGLQPRLVPNHNPEDGRNAARVTIPRCYFDKERCETGIEALKAYRREWDEKNRTFKDNPVKDWADHPADAFRYLSMAWREIVGTPQPANDRLLSVGSMNTVRFDDLWDDRPKRRARL